MGEEPSYHKGSIKKIYDELAKQSFPEKNMGQGAQASSPSPLTSDTGSDSEESDKGYNRTTSTPTPALASLQAAGKPRKDPQKRRLEGEGDKGSKTKKPKAPVTKEQIGGLSPPQTPSPSAKDAGKGGIGTG